MTTMLIAFNGTRENGNFIGDQLCYLKIAYLMVQNQPDVDRVIIALSPGNEMSFVWERFVEDPRGNGLVPRCDVVFDDFNPGDWTSRWDMWDRWRREKVVTGVPIDHYRELYLRIHGCHRQHTLCGYERGFGRRNIYEYVFYGQEHMPNECSGSDVYECEINHPPLTHERDVYISPHCKTQGNYTFTFEYWYNVIRKLLDAGLTVTVGYDGPFYEELNGHPLYRRFWGDFKQWRDDLCRHKIVACGNTGTGWLAAACKVPLLTMEPPNSQMPDHRYRECGLQNLVGVLSEPDADDCAKRLIEYVNCKVVMTTGCYDVLHAGHVRHLERSRAMGTRLVVALNSDTSVKCLKGGNRPINPQEDRKTILEALRCVDEVRLFYGPDAIELIKEIKPDVLTAGYGYLYENIVGRELVEGWGGSVAITCTDDRTDQPSTTKIVQRVLRSGDVVELCRVAAAYSVNPYEKLKLMADEFISVINLEGCVADLGSYRGGPGLILKRLAPDKQLYLFDTWEGTPFDDPLCDHKKGEWATSIVDCMKLVGDCNYVQGVFPYTCHDVKDRRFSFVYIDMDTYQSTKDAIDFFMPRMVKGGKMVFDDYGWKPCGGVQKAVDEMFPAEECERYKDMAGIPLRRVVESLHTCIITKR